jgi:hypothetical protein
MTSLNRQQVLAGLASKLRARFASR